MAEIAPILPHSPDAERAVLGGILINDKYLAEAKIVGLLPSEFYLPQNRVIYSELLALADLGKPLDFLTLQDSLTDTGKLDKAGGAGYIAQLIDGVPKITNLAFYAGIVREKARRRNLIHLTAKLQQRAFDNDGLEDLEKDLLSGIRAPFTNGNGNGHLTYGLTDFLMADFPAPDHLVDGVIPRNGTVLIIAKPHRLKSWFTTAMAMAATAPGQIMGFLEVPTPVRTILAQVEDFPGQVQWRMRQLMQQPAYGRINPDNLMVLPRGKGAITAAWYDRLAREAAEFKPDHIVLDVLRRVFHRGDVNSPKDSALYLEDIDDLRDKLGGCTVTLVHHENKKDAEIMDAGAGSYNFVGWANVVIHLKRKITEGAITHVEIEVDNKIGVAPDPMRMTLNLNAAQPVSLMSLDDQTGFAEAINRMGDEWDVRVLCEVLEVHKTNAYRRLKKWEADGLVERISTGKRGGKNRGLARYRAIQSTE